MRKTVIILSLVLMLSSFAGSALGETADFCSTFYGENAGSSNICNWPGSGASNTFIGKDAGKVNITGSGNTFLGFFAGSNTTVSLNTFMGYYSGTSNTTGERNTFMGNFSGFDNTTGSYNTFLGGYAGGSNTTGSYNIFIGPSAGSTNTVENYNTLIGFNADIDGLSDSVTNATAIGNKAYVSQSNSLVLGSIKYVNSAAASVNVGIGTSAPVRQLHVVGDQATFRMDRPTNTTAFMLVRTDGSGNPLKTFVVGTNASASNTGEFVINDLGTAVSGGGSRRMTIATDGSVNFPGAVTGASFTPVSSIAHKTNVKTYDNALETVKKLRGVSFNWKDSGKPSVGLIAEEVDKVIPEVVAHNDKDATGVNYDSLVGVLVEAVKEQQTELDTLREQKRINEEQQKIIAAHSEEIAELKRLLIMSRSVSKAD